MILKVIANAWLYGYLAYTAWKIHKNRHRIWNYLHDLHERQRIEESIRQRLAAEDAVEQALREARRNVRTNVQIPEYMVVDFPDGTVRRCKTTLHPIHGFPTTPRFDSPEWEVVE